jgi:hypothetical protein
MLALADKCEAVARAASGVFAALLSRGGGAAALGNVGGASLSGALLAEALFHANACTTHAHYNETARDVGARERDVFQLRNESARRHLMYARLLQLMSPEQRFAAHSTLVQVRLC